MKKFIFAATVMISQIASASSQLLFSEAKAPQFTFEIIEEGSALAITENNRKTKVKPKYSISDAQKLTIVSSSGDKLKETVEMLLVVLSKGAEVQIVEIFLPGQVDQVIQSSQTMPLCTFENFGDFSWEAAGDLKDRVQLVSGDGKSELRIKIAKLKNKADISSVESHWVKCFSF